MHIVQIVLAILVAVNSAAIAFGHRKQTVRVQRDIKRIEDYANASHV